LDAQSGPAVAGDIAWAPLVDVSQMSIRELFATDDSVIASCVRRLVGNLHRPDGILSGFQSFAS